MLRLPLQGTGDLGAAVAAARSVLAEHGVIAVPTETFYGLAVDPADALAVARVFDLKGRTAEKALPVLCASLEQAATLVFFRSRWRARLAGVWPAPLTVVAALRAPLPASQDRRTLAVRVPEHALLRGLLAEVGPLTGTSANRSGSAPEVDPDELVRHLDADLGLLLDGGRTAGGNASTLLDVCSEHARVLRAGPFEPPPAWDVE